MRKVKATPNGTRTMWNPRVKAICSRAGRTCAGSGTVSAAWDAASHVSGSVTSRLRSRPRGRRHGTSPGAFTRHCRLNRPGGASARAAPEQRLDREVGGAGDEQPRPGNDHGVEGLVLQVGALLPHARGQAVAGELREGAG